MDEVFVTTFLNHTLAMFLLFTASFVQSITGFGLSIISSPFLMLLYDAKTTVLMTLIISVFTNTIQVPLLYKHADYKMIGWLMVGAIFGLPIGVLVYQSCSNSILKLIISTLILIFLLSMHFSKSEICQCKRNSIVTGIIAGFLYTTTGMSGPPIIIYFAYINFSPQTLRATCILYFLFSAICSLIIFFINGIDLIPAAMEASYVIPGLLLGLFAGHKLFRYIPVSIFRRLIFGILYAACFYSIYTAVFI